MEGLLKRERIDGFKDDAAANLDRLPPALRGRLAPYLADGRVRLSKAKLLLLPNGQWGVVKEFHNLHGHIAYEAELAAYRVCQEKGVPLAPLAGKVKDGPYRALLYVLQDSGDLLQSMQENIGRDMLVPDQLLGWMEGLWRLLVCMQPTIEDVGIVHNDIKPENLLVRGSGELVLTDLEGAVLLHKGQSLPMYVGRFPMECIPSTPYSQDPVATLFGEISEESDVFPGGCTMLVMLLGTVLAPSVQTPAHKPSLMVADMLARHFGAMAAQGRAVTSTYFATQIGLHNMVTTVLLALALGALCPETVYRVKQETALRVVWLMRRAQAVYNSMTSQGPRRLEAQEYQYRAAQYFTCIAQGCLELSSLRQEERRVPAASLPEGARRVLMLLTTECLRAAESMLALCSVAYDKRELVLRRTERLLEGVHLDLLGPEDIGSRPLEEVFLLDGSPACLPDGAYLSWLQNLMDEEKATCGSFDEEDCLPGITDFQQYQEVVGRLSLGEAVDLTAWLPAPSPAPAAQSEAGGEWDSQDLASPGDFPASARTVSPEPPTSDGGPLQRGARSITKPALLLLGSEEDVLEGEAAEPGTTGEGVEAAAAAAAYNEGAAVDVGLGEREGGLEGLDELGSPADAKRAAAGQEEGEEVAALEVGAGGTTEEEVKVLQERLAAGLRLEAASAALKPVNPAPAVAPATARTYSRVSKGRMSVKPVHYDKAIIPSGDLQKLLRLPFGTLPDQEEEALSSALVSRTLGVFGEMLAEQRRRRERGQPLLVGEKEEVQLLISLAGAVPHLSVGGSLHVGLELTLSPTGFVKLWADVENPADLLGSRFGKKWSNKSICNLLSDHKALREGSADGGPAQWVAGVTALLKGGAAAVEALPVYWVRRDGILELMG